jgi:hypothetical protein
MDVEKLIKWLDHRIAVLSDNRDSDVARGRLAEARLVREEVERVHKAEARRKANAN